MTDIKNIMDYFTSVSEHPGEVKDRYIAEGKKVIGCFPIYTPQPLVTALGMVPMGLYGGQVNPTVASKYNPIYTCSIMKSCLEYGMSGAYKGLSAAIMPMLCDTFRGMSSGWRAGVKDIPLISFIHPQNRSNYGAHDFLVSEYEQVKKKLEAIAGKTLSEDKLNETLDLYNERNSLVREFLKLANDHLDIINAIARHKVMKALTFLEVREGMDNLKKLVDALKGIEPYEWKGKRVILTGITAEPDEFLEIFIENNVAVVGDDLAQESRQYRTDYPDGESALGRMSSQWLNVDFCSTAYNEDKRKRGKGLVELAKENNADCIADCLMRFCDVEEYDYPYISEMTEEAGLYSLCLEIDQSTQDNGQSRTKIQSYAEL